MQLPSSSPHPFSRVYTLFRQGFAVNPLLALMGLACLVALVGTLIGLVVDHRVITGAPAWLKPAKFAISVSIYCFTMLWIMSFVKGHKRLIQWVANGMAIGFLVEMCILITQVLRDTTSHFNISTPLDGGLYTMMAVFIVIVWILTLLVGLLLLFQRGLDPAFAWALRLGIVLALIGMALGFLMTSRPTPEQQATMHAHKPLTTMGAHSVGVPDGGPGLPLVGWSTIGGDLRIPHFVGLHALQVLPLLWWLLSLPWLGWLRRGHRVALVWLGSGSYLGLIALLTWQALRGQSIIAPDAQTFLAFTLLSGVTIASAAVVIWHARTSLSSRVVPA